MFLFCFVFFQSNDVAYAPEESLWDKTLTCEQQSDSWEFFSDTCIQLEGVVLSRPS